MGHIRRSKWSSLWYDGAIGYLGRDKQVSEWKTTISQQIPITVTSPIGLRSFFSSWHAVNIPRQPGCDPVTWNHSIITSIRLLILPWPCRRQSMQRIAGEFTQPILEPWKIWLHRQNILCFMAYYQRDVLLLSSCESEKKLSGIRSGNNWR